MFDLLTIKLDDHQSTNDGQMADMTVSSMFVMFMKPGPGQTRFPLPTANATVALPTIPRCSA